MRSGLGSRALAAVCGLALGTACDSGETVLEPCSTVLKVRLPSPSPLNVAGRPAGAAVVTIERAGKPLLDELVVWSDQMSFALRTPSAPVLVDAATDFQLKVNAYATFAGKPVVASGRTAAFSCPDADSYEVDLYLGPSNGLAPLEQAVGERVGATVTSLGDRLLVVGGQRADGTPATPGAYLYTHRTGKLCAADCMQDVPAPRWKHTSTLLEDGRVLIVGGMDESGVRGDMLVFEPADDSFQTLESTLELFDHASVLLSLAADSVAKIRSDLRGRVAVFGGESPSGVVSDAWLIDADGTGPPTRLSGNLVVPRSKLTAVLTSGDGVVLIAGGLDGEGRPSAEADVFDAGEGRANTVIPLDTLCASGAGVAMCSRRVGHTASRLGTGGDEVVVFWGGELEAVEDEALAPQVEVYSVEHREFKPLDDASLEALLARTGHAASPVGCEPGRGTCSLLISGGVDPAGMLPVLPQQMVVKADEGGFFSATLTTLDDDPALQRTGHISATLVDGTVVILGGARVGGGAPEDLALSPCFESAAATAENVTCPPLLGR